MSRSPSEIRNMHSMQKNISSFQIGTAFQGTGSPTLKRNSVDRYHLSSHRLDPVFYNYADKQPPQDDILNMVSRFKSLSQFPLEK